MTLLNLVAKHLNPAEIGSLKESFLAMDEDGSGFLTVGFGKDISSASITSAAGRWQQLDADPPCTANCGQAPRAIALPLAL